MNKVERSIVIWGVCWLIITVALFLYGFSFFDSKTLAVQTELSTAKGELSKLKAEQQAVKLAKQDLEAVTTKKIQPTDFFKKDTTLVDQVQELEQMSKKYDLDFQLGLSGTISNGTPVKGIDGIVMIPFNVSVSGSLQNVEKFIESFEHMPYIVYENSINITSAAHNQVNAQMSANFFIRK
jgi:Tfp pilus assembly protein PilO